MRAYWEGYLDNSDRAVELQKKWSHLTRAERASALDLAELMTAEFMGFRRDLNWMVEHLEDPVTQRRD